MDLAAMVAWWKGDLESSGLSLDSSAFNECRLVKRQGVGA